MEQILAGTYSSTVTLGSGMFSSQVAVTGTIDLGLNTGDGIYAAASVLDAYVLNIGTIYGGIIGSPSEAGCGIYLSGAGEVSNNLASAIIRGGEGTSPQASARPGTSGYAGGVGVDLNDGGTLANLGLVAGALADFPWPRAARGATGSTTPMARPRSRTD